MGEQGRSYAEEHYDWGKLAGEIAAGLEILL